MQSALATATSTASAKAMSGRRACKSEAGRPISRLSDRSNHISSPSSWWTEFDLRVAVQLEARAGCGPGFSVSRLSSKEGRCGGDDHALSIRGSVKRNTAPPAAWFSAQIFPPRASMIVREIDNPSPVPCALVV